MSSGRHAYLLVMMIAGLAGCAAPDQQSPQQSAASYHPGNAGRPAWPPVCGGLRVGANLITDFPAPLPGYTCEPKPDGAGYQPLYFEFSGWQPKGATVDVLFMRGNIYQQPFNDDTTAFFNSPAEARSIGADTLALRRDGNTTIGPITVIPPTNNEGTAVCIDAFKKFATTRLHISLCRIVKDSMTDDFALDIARHLIAADLPEITVVD